MTTTYVLLPVRLSQPLTDLVVNDALTRLVEALPGTARDVCLSTTVHHVPGDPLAFTFDVGVSAALPEAWVRSFLDTRLQAAHGRVLGELGTMYFGPARRATLA